MRRRGPMPRGDCPDCGRNVHLLKGGAIGTHRRLYKSGATGSYCLGIRKEPVKQELDKQEDV
jgi:hypothetical protein